MADAVERCDLDLRGLTVLTEAATGAYVITPVLAALAGADVFALTRSTRFGTFEEVRDSTLELAGLTGIRDRIQVIDGASKDAIQAADIVTNSGHVRPIDAAMIEAMKPGAVIPLMYESWEFRESDVDLAACRSRGIAVAGTNERHPDVDVFSFLGIMAVKLLLDAGVAVPGSSVLLLCDNDFGPFLLRGLRESGAIVHCSKHWVPSQFEGGVDAIVVAMRPQRQPALGTEQVLKIALERSGAIVLQLWGDIPRKDLAEAGVPFWPLPDVPPGHMGILPSEVGPEPIVRLQSGGLKVGQVMAAATQTGADPVEAAIRSGFGQGLLSPQEAVFSHQ
jgi:hypothetical protein